MPSTKRTMVRHELSSSLPHVLPLILQVLQQPSQGEMTVQAIKCLQAWVQFGIPMEETAPIVQRLLLAGKNVFLNLFTLCCICLLTQLLFWAGNQGNRQNLC
jgi:hypothetical protein